MLAKLNKNWLIGMIVVVIIALLLFLNHKGNIFGQEKMTVINEYMNEETDDNNDETNNEHKQKQHEIIVDVKGEVHNPGVYEVEQDVRIHQVIDLAGGFTEDANEEFVNLAQRVHDEMIISVPAIGEKHVQHAAQSPIANVIRINYATQEEIEQLSGIGPEKAKAIIKYREEKGNFTTVEDLLDISGIGEKTLDNIRENIQIP